MTREQASALADRILAAKSRRPTGVIDVRLYLNGGVGRLVSLWDDRAVLDAYLRSVDTPRGTELMRAVGLEPTVSVADVLTAE